MNNYFTEINNYGSTISPNVVSFSSTINLDMAVYSDFTLTLTGNAVIANPTSFSPGNSGVIVIAQDSIGNRSVSFGNSFLFQNGVSPVLSSSPGAIDTISYTVISQTEILCVMHTNFSAPLILDQLSVLPNVAYGLRSLTKTYNGPLIQVRRSSDNAVMNINAINGVLDTLTLMNFCGSGNGFISKWYNQGISSSGYDMIQPNIAYQPQIVTNGVVETTNGLPAVLGNRSNTLYLFSNNVASQFNSTEFTFNTVSKLVDEDYQSLILGTTDPQNNGGLQMGWGGTDIFGMQIYGQSGGDFSIPVTTNLVLITGIWTVLGSVLFLNGENQGSVSTPTGPLNASGNFVLFGGPSVYSGASTFGGYISEIVGFTNSLSTSDRSILENNQRIYFSIT